MKAFLILGVMTMALASRGVAQYSGFPRTADPAYWVSGGVGAFNGQGVQDGSTHSEWDFGRKTSWQYRGSLEKAIQNESSIGLVGTFVTVPFTYSQLSCGTACASSGTTQGATCSGCAAHLQMMSLEGQFHAGGGTGLHQVLEVAVGATAYRNLKRDSDGAVLAPKGGNVDGSFSLAYGFGYGLSNTTELTLVQDYGLVLHESTGLQGSSSNTNTVRSIRAGLRYGFGARSRSIRRR